MKKSLQLSAAALAFGAACLVATTASSAVARSTVSALTWDGTEFSGRVEGTLGTVLPALAAQMPIEFSGVSPELEQERVAISLANVPLTRLLDRVLRGRSYMIRIRADGVAARPVIRVRILGSGSNRTVSHDRLAPAPSISSLPPGDAVKDHEHVPAPANWPEEAPVVSPLAGLSSTELERNVLTPSTPDRRVAALAELQRRGDLTTALAIDRSLADAHADIRLGALIFLEERAGTDAEIDAALRHVAQHDSERHLRQLARQVLRDTR